jgi:catechol 2,3-dioxygenase-like lactoylglutathione lyase family enzyme
MAIKDGNVTIMVKDMDKSISFYESLGLKLQNRWGNHYAQLGISGLTIGIHPEGKEFPATGSGSLSLGFTIDNIEESTALLQNLGIDNYARDEEGGQFLHFKDPDGTELYFIKPKWG